MAYRVRTVRDLEEYAAALGGIGHYFGWVPSAEDVERFSTMLPQERLHAVLDDGSIVAGAGAYPLELTLPAGPTPCAGVTVVGVLPTHRRRGLLRRMMDAQLRDIRERGEPVAALWASEETIYGRFGYGLASLCMNLDVRRRAVRVRPELPRVGSVRLVDNDEALRVLPRLYDRVRRSNTGFVSRSRDWWEIRKLSERTEVRRGAGPLVRALYERDGRPAGWALYRIAQEGSTVDDWKKTVKVSEVQGLDDDARRELWRYLFEIDWTDRVTVDGLAVDDSVLLDVDRLNQLRARVYDGLWVRAVDVRAALAARGVARDGRATIEVTADPDFADNVGAWSVEGDAVRRSSRRPDVRVDVDGLGATLLGGFTFAQLARSGRAEEGRRGGLARADALFRVERAPWCPEIF
ncbi:MAG TPA: GNAT family N-acetyltransferase [Gaiella sp.]|jgi:predicted acetyltransferase|nr:GNAT family N-acetyltransferase [Gaiella sp.]